MSSNTKKWDDASEKDLIFAILMSTRDGTGSIKADWPKVDEIMTQWGYNFTAGAMSQRWSKTILKAFKERHPDNQKDGGKADPATPSKAAGAGSRTRNTPASAKNQSKGNGKKRPRGEDEDSSPEGAGPFNPNPIAKEKTPRSSAKKMKYSEKSDEDDEGEPAVIKGEEAVDEDFDHAV